MKLKTTIISALASAASLGLASVAMAVPVPLGSSTGSLPVNVSYTAGGLLTASDPSVSYQDRITNAPVAMTPFMLTSGTPISFDPMMDVETFSGGSFSYGSFLSGTFGTSILRMTSVGTNLTGGTFDFISNDVTFTGGSDQHGFAIGSVSLEALNAFDSNGGVNFVNATKTGFNSFTATDGVTINALPNAVPEPSTFALSGFGLLGLMLCARKRSAARS